MIIVDNDAIKEVVEINDNGTYIAKTIITKEAFVKAYNEWIINDWLSSFNTDSATACFTAIQQLKQKVRNK